jgi:ATP-dependent helicase HrpB
MQNLPVAAIIPELKEALRQHNRIVLSAPPGAGKSTALPVELLGESWLNDRKIFMLEPRRLAARSVAVRMAELLGESPGESIGYRIRFESVSGPQTRLEVLTEGILTRMLVSDPLLEEAGLLIFDEFHERSLQADTGLALALKIQALLRPDLRILVMSATLAEDSLMKALQHAVMIKAQGRMFPVEVRYVEPPTEKSIAENIASCVLRALREEQGDILCFLPGSGDIMKAAELLDSVSADILPLYGDLPFSEQQKIIKPHPTGKRKVILSTSIAETSLTIEGVRVVIDSGYSRLSRFDAKTGLSRLVTEPSTLDTAEQRKGRAGRTTAGVCYRLWAQRAEHLMKAHRLPEIAEADLAPLLLDLMAMGEHDIQSLPWVSAPPKLAVINAEKLLQQLGATENGKISVTGRRMQGSALHPRLAHMIQSCNKEDEKTWAIFLAAFLQEKDFMGKERYSDIAERMQQWLRWQEEKKFPQKVFQLRQAFQSLCKSERVSGILKPFADMLPGALLFSAFPERAAKRQEGHQPIFKLGNGKLATLPSEDPLAHESWIVAAHLDTGEKSGRIYLAAALSEQEPLSRSRTRVVMRLSDDEQRIECIEERRYEGIVMGTRPAAQPPEEEWAAFWISLLQEKGFRWLKTEERIRQLFGRIFSLRNWNPHEAWPDLSEAQLLETAAQWLPIWLQGIRRVSDLRKLDWYQIFSGLLPWELLQKLEQLAPEKIEVPSGSQITIRYQADGSSPVLSVRLQEVFGWTESPCINAGKTPLLLELLSPGFKPVQLTKDLNNFWKHTYFEVRKDLRNDYPKHAWPEEPLKAEAVRGVKKKREGY